MKRIYRGFKTDCPTGICLDLCFFTPNAIGLDLSVQYAIYITSEYKSYTKLRCTFEFVEWVAHRSKSHGGGEQKAHEYTYFVRIAL